MFKIIVLTEPDIAALCRRARRGVSCLLCVVEDVGAPLPPRSRSMKADAIRLRIISKTSRKRPPSCTTARRRRQMMRAAAWPWLRRMTIGVLFLKKICSMSSLQRASARHVTFLLPVVYSFGLFVLWFWFRSSQNGRVDTYGLGEFCGSGTKVDDLFLLHVEISDGPSVWVLGGVSALLHTSEMLIFQLWNDAFSKPRIFPLWLA